MNVNVIKRIAMALTCLLTAFPLHAETAGVGDEPVQVTTRKVNGSYGQVIVKLKTDRFDPHKHSIKKKNGFGYVDGRRVIGTDGAVPPFMEFVRFEITWNGKPVPIAREMYASIYNAQLNKGEGVTLAVSDREDAIMITFVCGDAVRESVWLTIGRNGSWHRFIKSEGED